MVRLVNKLHFKLGYAFLRFGSSRTVERIDICCILYVAIIGLSGIGPDIECLLASGPRELDFIHRRSVCSIAKLEEIWAQGLLRHIDLQSRKLVLLEFDTGRSGCNGSFNYARISIKGNFQLVPLVEFCRLGAEPQVECSVAAHFPSDCGRLGLLAVNRPRGVVENHIVIVCLVVTQFLIHHIDIVNSGHCAPLRSCDYSL